MRKFFYLSAGLMCLAITFAIAFHLGSRSVNAQAPEPITGYRVGFASGLFHHYVMLSTGDVYLKQGVGQFGQTGAPVFVGNFWAGTVPTSESTWGSVKDAYKK